MSEDGKAKYVWAVEWENPFAQDEKRGVVFYDVTLQPGVTEEEFEKFLEEEGFPAVGGILTRAIQFKRQYLLRDAGEGGPDPLNRIQKEGVTEKLAALCKHKTGRNYVVLGQETASEE